ncbi:hypothetical protein D9M70_472230 [compost metagenome]
MSPINSPVVAATRLVGTKHGQTMPNGDDLVVLHHHVAISGLFSQLPLGGRQAEQHLPEMRPVKEIHPRPSVPSEAPKDDQPFDLLNADATLTATLHGMCTEFHCPTPLLDVDPRPVRLVIRDRRAPSLPSSGGHICRICRVTGHTNNGRSYRSIFQAGLGGDTGKRLTAASLHRRMRQLLVRAQPRLASQGSTMRLRWSRFNMATPPFTSAVLSPVCGLMT